MATFEQYPSEQQPLSAAGVSNALNSLLARVYTLNWELIFYVGIFILAVATRFVNLGDRVMSHDESLHTKYSHDLYKQGLFQHTPLMHGPVLFHMTALAYFLFGDSDFSARLYPAVLGVIMVLMPKLLFGRWLGKFGAMAASVFILISPMLLYHHRYIREDTPAIFFTMLMAYAVFAYIDGVKPRQSRFLILLAGATLLNLASKETAFMYIAIFGIFFIPFLLIQMMQGWRAGAHSKMIGWAVFGTLVVPIAGVAATVIIAALGINVGEVLPPELAVQTGGGTGRDAAELFMVVVLGIPIALGLCVAAVVAWRAFMAVFGKGIVLPLIDFIAQRGTSVFRLVMAGGLIGLTAALLMTNVLSIITPEGIRSAQNAWSAWVPGTPEPSELHPDVLLGRLAFFSIAITLILAASLVITAGWQFRRQTYLPWGDILFVTGLAIAVFFVSIVVEERSRAVPNVSSEARPAVATLYNYWLWGGYVVGILAVGGIILLRSRTQFWQQMRRYPAFDILIVIGSLVLPWLAALPIFLAGYQLDTSSYTPQQINAMILGIIPYIAIAVAAGLAWRPGVWLACAATFYGIFAVFFTTVFTNPQGVATGVVGSLGYWLAQQGVRRGSQPQYYYMLIQLPIYEYLVVIGAACAGVLGLGAMWRFRAARYAEREAIREEERQAALNAELQANLAADPFTVGAESAPDAAQTLTNNPTLLNELGENVQVSNAAEPMPVHRPIKKKRETLQSEWLLNPMFVTFTAFWGLMILFALTLAGEKMPWLTTHIALPFALLTGWYVGKVLEAIDWQAFWRSGWSLLLLIPTFIVGAVNVVGPIAFGSLRFGDVSREAQLTLFSWFGAVILAGAALYAIVRVWRNIATPQAWRVVILGGFVLLGILTARAAWLAAYINYDSATEFLVYAHGAPANKWVINEIENISRRITDGMQIKAGYDNEFSWPGSWYFRNFPQGRYLGDLTGATGLDEYVVLVVGDNNVNKIDPQVAAKFYRFDYIRLWWPMQEYFNLNLKRVDQALGDAEMRQALWDIWMNRDYTRYTSAHARLTGDQNTKFEPEKWPVADRMSFFVRKDVAAQVWDLGVGSARVTGLPEDPFRNLRCDTCSAELNFGPAEPALNAPRGLAIGPDGNLYTVDSRNSRVVVYTPDGRFLRAFGTPSQGEADPALGVLREPWGITVGADGTVYVADTWNHRIQSFLPDGTPIKAWGVFEQVDPAAPSGSQFGFYGPRDVEIDAGGRLFVADTGNRRVRVYTSDGAWLYDFGLQGAVEGQLFEPVGLAINNRTQEIFVASTWNKRISVYTLSGQFVRTWEIQAWAGTSPTADSGNRPYITLDPSGTYLFVTDPDAGRLLIYDVLGNPVLAVGRLGSAPYTMLNQFGVLGGLVMDSQSRLYLADAGGGRLVRFSRAAFPGLVLPGAPISGPGNLPFGGPAAPPATEAATEAATEPVTEPATEAAPTQEATRSAF